MSLWSRRGATLNKTGDATTGLDNRLVIDERHESKAAMLCDKLVDHSVLVVIPCLNEASHLAGLVTELTCNNVMRMHIVIVDGGSQDGTLELARNLETKIPNVSVLSNPKQIQSAGINLAVSEFGEHAEFLIRIDAHAVYPSDYCRILVDEAERTGAASVVVAMETLGEGGFQKAVADAQNSRLGNGGAAHRRGQKAGEWADHGHHALMRIGAFMAVGGYDETFSHNEDVELDVRLRQHGFRIWLTGQTQIKYYPRSTAKSLFRQYLNWGKGRAKTMIKHRSMPRLRQLLPAAILPISLLALASPFSGVAAIPVMAWLALCLGSGLWFAIKRRRIGSLASGVAAIIMHLGFSVGFWSALVRHAIITTLPRRNWAV